MEIKFTVEEIRNHLAELGYQNVPEDKLNTFVSDLKRLIRYEEKRKNLEKKLAVMDNKKSNNRTSPIRKLRDKRKAKSKDVQDGGNVFVSGNLERTTSTVKNVRAQVCKESVDEAGCTTSTITTTTSVQEELHQTEKSSLYVDIVIPRPVETKKSAVLTATLLQQRPTSGVIRCRSTTGNGVPPVRRGRSDPVSLHQEYKKAWEKLNLPGETSHNKLRWAVRGWMIGEEPS